MIYNPWDSESYKIHSTDGKMSTLWCKAGGGGYLILTYQDKTGPLMANSHPGSYSGQDAYSDMLITDRGGGQVWATTKASFMTNWTKDKAQTLVATDWKDAPVIISRGD